MDAFGKKRAYGGKTDKSGDNGRVEGQRTSKRKTDKCWGNTQSEPHGAENGHAEEGKSTFGEQNARLLDDLFSSC